MPLFMLSAALLRFSDLRKLLLSVTIAPWSYGIDVPRSVLVTMWPFDLAAYQGRNAGYDLAAFFLATLAFELEI
jgi:hypothetical protein